MRSTRPTVSTPMEIACSWNNENRRWRESVLIWVAPEQYRNLFQISRPFWGAPAKRRGFQRTVQALRSRGDRKHL
jgi:hypothetical protein